MDKNKTETMSWKADIKSRNAILNLHRKIINQCNDGDEIKRMRRRYLLYTEDKPYQCNQCDMAFSRCNSLVAHLKKHKGENIYQCSHCDMAFTLNSSLTSHMQKYTGKKAYHCASCRKQFSNKCHLQRHSRTHTGEEMSLEKTYQCIPCDKDFIDMKSYQYHLQTHNCERPYVCSECGKSFMQNSFLIDQLRTHTGETLYQCNQCVLKSCEQYVSHCLNTNNVNAGASTTQVNTREERPCQENTGEKRPYQENIAEKRPYQENTRDERPYQENTGEERPYQENTGEERPYQETTREERPYQENTIEERPNQEKMQRGHTKKILEWRDHITNTGEESPQHVKFMTPPKLFPDRESAVKYFRLVLEHTKGSDFLTGENVYSQLQLSLLQTSPKISVQSDSDHKINAKASTNQENIGEEPNQEKTGEGRPYKEHTGEERPQHEKHMTSQKKSR